MYMQMIEARSFENWCLFSKKCSIRRLTVIGSRAAAIWFRKLRLKTYYRIEFKNWKSVEILGIFKIKEVGKFRGFIDDNDLALALGIGMIYEVFLLISSWANSEYHVTMK
jgi:hypothetical protein